MNSRSESCSTLAPLLDVRHGAKAIDFYKAAFGAAVIFSTPAFDLSRRNARNPRRSMHFPLHLNFAELLH
jgi:uncharacterized glyoxalase superfamily protein PhnB